MSIEEDRLNRLLEYVQDFVKGEDDYAHDNGCKTSMASDGAWVQIWHWFPGEFFDEVESNAEDGRESGESS